MNSFKFFRLILALVNLVLLIFLFFASIFLIYVLGGGGITYPLELAPDFLPRSKNSLLSFLLFFLVITGGYFYFFSILRKLAQSMGRKLFTQNQVKDFKYAGRLLIFLTILVIIVAFIISISFEGIYLSISFSEILLYSGFACFLLVLGEVFSRGRMYKEENELTV